jgi:hypothetical protein
MFSDPTDCFMYNGQCASHSSRHMFQILSLRLAKIPAERGSIELYGYIAVRDYPDTSLNYIVNFTRDNPIIMEQVCTSIHVSNYLLKTYLNCDTKYQVVQTKSNRIFLDSWLLPSKPHEIDFIYL